jgi:putative transposase
MAQSLADILVHIVFSTKDREGFIDPSIEQELHRYITGICAHHNSPVLAINGMQDHIHILLSLGREIAISKLITEIKANSSRWIKSKGQTYHNFQWQNGYGIFSVARKNIENVINYIGTQKEHHKVYSFKDEFIRMLQQLNVAYDEKYVWG